VNRLGGVLMNDEEKRINHERNGDQNEDAFHAEEDYTQLQVKKLSRFSRGTSCPVAAL